MSHLQLDMAISVVRCFGGRIIVPAFLMVELQMPLSDQCPDKVDISVNSYSTGKKRILFQGV